MGTKTMREAPRVARSLVAAIIAQVLDLVIRLFVFMKTFCI
jgi:hypothetical protein